MLSWHQPFIQAISSRLDSRRLHHALLFYGFPGVGKRVLCKDVAAILLCSEKDKPCGQCQSCKLFAAETHPDLNIIEPDNTIGVDTIRAGIQKLQHTSQLGGAQVLIIEQAQKMTPAAANALLKTLEEPNAGTYILLACDQLHGLLPTIISRCEKHLVSVSDKQQIAKWFEEAGNPMNSTLFSMYWQRPLYLSEQLTEDEINIINQLDLSAKNGSCHVNQLPEAIYEHPQLLLDWLSNWSGSMLRKGILSDKLTESLLSFEQQLIVFRQRCQQQGANKKLQISNLMADFAGILTDMTHSHVKTYA